jgi:hypothetical protein
MTVTRVPLPRPCSFFPGPVVPAPGGQAPQRLSVVPRSPWERPETSRGWGGHWQDCTSPAPRPDQGIREGNKVAEQRRRTDQVRTTKAQPVVSVVASQCHDEPTARPGADTATTSSAPTTVVAPAGPPTRVAAAGATVARSRATGEVSHAQRCPLWPRSRSRHPNTRFSRE